VRVVRRNQDVLAQLAARATRFQFGPRLYVIGEPEYVKIGWAVSPQKRMAELQMGNARRLEILVTVPLYVCPEKAAHNRFAHLRAGGEWFRRTAEIDAFIRELKQRLTIERRMQRRIQKTLTVGLRPRPSRMEKLNHSVWWHGVRAGLAVNAPKVALATTIKSAPVAALGEFPE
jgi:hypothetical protein